MKNIIIIIAILSFSISIAQDKEFRFIKGTILTQNVKYTEASYISITDDMLTITAQLKRQSNITVYNYRIVDISLVGNNINYDLILKDYDQVVAKAYLLSNRLVVQVIDTFTNTSLTSVYELE